MLHNVKDVLIGANRKVKSPEVMRLVNKIVLRNKNKVKVDDVMDILKGRSIRVRQDKG